MHLSSARIVLLKQGTLLSAPWKQQELQYSYHALIIPAAQQLAARAMVKFHPVALPSAWTTVLRVGHAMLAARVISGELALKCASAASAAFVLNVLVAFPGASASSPMHAQW